MTKYKLSPSDFAYLYRECKYCYYMKVKHKIYRPYTPFPAVFSVMNSNIQNKLVGKNLRILSSKLPDVEIISQEKFVESKLIPNTSLYIKGKYDLLGKNSDGTYTIIDLKISKPDENKVKLFEPQLNSYKYCMENPSQGKAYSVTRLALLIFYPYTAEFENHAAHLTFPPKWIDVPINQGGFIKYIKKIDEMIKKPNFPSKGVDCEFCPYTYKRVKKKFL